MDKDRTIIIPFKTKPRRRWEVKFKSMAENKDDKLFFLENIDLDSQVWEW